MRARLAVIASLATLGSLALVQSASAGTASISGGEVVEFQSAAGETNTVTVSHSGAAYIVTDSTAPLTAGGGCTALTANSASCPDSGIDGLSVDLGDQNDTGSIASSVSGPSTGVFGDVGNDTLVAGSGVRFGNYLGGVGDDMLVGSDSSDRLDGGDGKDQLLGGGGSDSLEGDADRDVVDGGAGNDQIGEGSSANGADVITGGEGPFDALSYGGRDGGVAISANGAADDGEGCPGPACEGDNVDADIERIRSGDGNDTISLGPGDEQIDGSDGDDVIDAGAGNDGISGDAGNDTLSGGDGNDGLQGGPGTDTMAGGPGDDVIEADISDDLEPDVLTGGSGLDLADYSGAAEPLRIDLDNKADDGQIGEGDNVASDIEDVNGGDGDDVITGSKRANDFAGGRGSDKLTGLAGSDSIIGGPGADKLFGGKGQDLLDGGEGPDSLFSRDHGRDEDRCGSAADIAKIDRVDRRGPDCDKVQLPKKGRKK